MSNVAFARPCVGCGYCCKEAMCITGRIAALRKGKLETLLQAVEVCPFLYHDGERYLCELAEEMSFELCIGAGCCSPLNTNRQAMLKKLAKRKDTQDVQVFLQAP